MRLDELCQKDCAALAKTAVSGKGVGKECWPVIGGPADSCK